jgi:hypothetical protein
MISLRNACRSVSARLARVAEDGSFSFDWLNLDLVWAVALIATGFVATFV